MGTRTVFQVLDGDRNLIATLFANSSHTTQFAEAVFKNTIKDSTNRGGPNALIEKLLSLRYETAEGNHEKGERIFWLVPADEAQLGDRESIIKVTHAGASEELVTKGYMPLAGPAWSYERVELEEACAAVEAGASDSEDLPVEEIDFDNQTVTELATQFVTALRSKVGDDVYLQIVALNKAETDPGICHSHDFVDANMVMAMAFTCVTGTAVDVRSSSQSLLWSRSWAQAVRDMKQ